MGWRIGRQQRLWDDLQRASGGRDAKVLFNFDDTHGGHPYGSLIASGSMLYGMTEWGGSNYSSGVIFSEPVGGGTPTVLFNFGGTHGSEPYGSLILSGSTLYGMTDGGGADYYGSVFAEPVAGGTPTDLLDFDKTDGAWPQGDLTLSGSSLYGMAHFGGANNYGVIFSVPVPEPSAIAGLITAALTAGGIGLVSWRRRPLAGRSRDAG